MTVQTDHDTAFQSALVAIIPQLRAFARSLCRDATEAEDLAQEAVARAWVNRGRSRWAPT